jgi:hypothetical protein
MSSAIKRENITELNDLTVSVVWATVPNAYISQSSVTQHQAALSIATSQLTGTLADARVAESNVTQHQAALSIATSQLTGTLADARVAESNVTQYKVELDVLTQNSRSANYTLALSDGGNHILHPSSDTNNRTYTIPANSSVAFPIGTAITIVNDSVNDVSIPITSDTLIWAGDGSTGTRTLAQYGIATLLKIGTTTWYINGIGIS